MSRFKDLDQHLQQEGINAQNQEEERIRKLLEARAQWMPQLQQAYAVLGDFYFTILQPKGYRLFPRQKEGPTENELRHLNSTTVLYAYVANILSPSSEQPYPDVTDDSFRTWAQQQIGELDYHVWHSNISLHFAALLKPAQKGTTIDQVRLGIEMRAWGRINIDERAPTPQGVRVSFGDAGWDHNATFVTIDPEVSRLGDQVDAGLRLLTPNIIHHKEAFRK